MSKQSFLYLNVQVFAADVRTSHVIQPAGATGREAVHLSVKTGDGRGDITVTGTPAELHDVLARLGGELAEGERELREPTEPTEPEGDGS